MRRITFLSVSALLLASVFTSSTLLVAAVNNTPQTLPFSQNWTNTGLITTNDDWSMVPGIVGFLGDITTTTQAAIDPRTVLTDFTTQDVVANQTNPDTNTSGGVAEFEIANPTVALQGSGTADAPNIVIYLNTTGQSNIRVAFNARDIDAQVDDAVQPIAVQYRVGTTGDFSNVPGGYFPDVTSGASQATQVTAIAVTLPPAANNQPNVQVRILTTNAAGSDEWVGIDDISVTAGGAPNTARTENDYNGDGRTDYVVTRTISSLKNWFVAFSGRTDGFQVQWGLGTDIEVPADYDGDGRTDVAVYRPAAAPNSFFYVLQSMNNTLLSRELGATGDDPTVVGDYDGDGRADMAVFRANAGGGQSFWYYRPSATNPNGIVFVPWGAPGDIAIPGEYDGDGKWDFCVRRTTAGNQNLFILRKNGGTAATDEYIVWGSSNDAIAPAGDYDGDGRMDFAVIRNDGSQRLWSVLGRNNNNIIHFALPFGMTTDFLTPGDYDGDGRTDIAVWRQSNDPTMNFFYVRQSSTGSLTAVEWGQSGDDPVAGFRVRNLSIIF